MAGRGQGPDFVEALARGLDVIACFDRERPEMSLSDVAQATGLARPTARRLLLTLEELGFVRSRDGLFALTPRVLTLGMAYVGVAGAVGDRPARASRRWSGAPASPRRWPSSTAPTSSTSPGCRCPRSSRCGSRSAPASRRRRPRRARCCSRRLDPASLDAVLATPSRAGSRPARRA